MRGGERVDRSVAKFLPWLDRANDDFWTDPEKCGTIAIVPSCEAPSSEPSAS